MSRNLDSWDDEPVRKFRSITVGLNLKDRRHGL